MIYMKALDNSGLLDEQALDVFEAAFYQHHEQMTSRDLSLYYHTYTKRYLNGRFFKGNEVF